MLLRLMLSLLLCTASTLGAGGPAHGRRLFQKLAPRPTAQKPKEQPPAPDAGPEALTANQTISLLREREVLQARLSTIDRALAADRDQKRRALTEQYEREMQRLEEEDLQLGARASPSPDIKQQVSAALSSYHPRNGLPHQDVEHQDIDIDVMMMHIDKDGDGVITPTEAYGLQHSGLQAGTQLLGSGGWKLLAPALIGCTCALACYLSLRHLLMLRMRSAAHREAAHGNRGLPSDASRKRQKNAGLPSFYNRQ